MFTGICEVEIDTINNQPLRVSYKHQGTITSLLSILLHPLCRHSSLAPSAVAHHRRIWSPATLRLPLASGAATKWTTVVILFELV
jgi:hypothetical protein